MAPSRARHPPPLRPPHVPLASLFVAVVEVGILGLASALSDRTVISGAASPVGFTLFAQGNGDIRLTLAASQGVFAVAVVDSGLPTTALGASTWAGSVHAGGVAPLGLTLASLACPVPPANGAPVSSVAPGCGAATSAVLQLEAPLAGLPNTSLPLWPGYEYALVGAPPGYVPPATSGRRSVVHVAPHRLQVGLESLDHEAAGEAQGPAGAPAGARVLSAPLQGLGCVVASEYSATARTVTASLCGLGHFALVTRPAAGQSVSPSSSDKAILGVVLW
jgi:hypothetical protein